MNKFEIPACLLETGFLMDAPEQFVFRNPGLIHMQDATSIKINAGTGALLLVKRQDEGF